MTPEVLIPTETDSAFCGLNAVENRLRLVIVQMHIHIKTLRRDEKL